MFRNGLVLLVLLLRSVIVCPAQSVPMQHFTINDGLPSNLVYGVYGDSKGFLWITTDKGIARYNGFSFTAFSIADGLLDNDVFNAKEDLYGRLWFGSFNGGLCYYQDGRFHTAANTPWLQLPVKGHQFFSGISLQPDSSILITSFDGQQFLSIKGERIRVLTVPKVNPLSLPINPPLNYRRLTSNKLRLYFSQSFADIDSNGKIMEQQKYRLGSPLKLLTTIDRNYGFNDKGIFTFDGQFISPLKNYAQDSLSMCLSGYINKDITLIGSEKGLLLNDSIWLLKNIFVTGANRDISGNYWVSTRGKGVYLISRNLLDIQQCGSYPGIVMNARLLKDKLYFITDNGNLYTLKSDKLTCLFNSVAGQYVPPSFPLTKGHFLLSDSGEYFTATVDKLFLIKDVLDQPPLKPIRIYTGNALVTKELLADGKSVLIATINNILKINYRQLPSGGSTSATQYLLKTNSQRSGRIYSRAIDPADSSLWFSRTDGMFRLSHEQLLPQPAFTNITLRQFTFFKHYLIGFTDDNKLLLYNINTQTITQDSNHNCIWENIYAIDDRHLLISSNNYYRILNLYPEHNNKLRYSIQVVEDPLLPNRAEYIAASSDWCYFFKEGKITKIKTAALLQGALPPTPVFLTFRTGKKTKNIRPQITISYQESRNISLLFDNISFAGKDITCEYSISDNPQDNWQRITGNEINLNTPGFGDYTIKIRAKTLSSKYSTPIVLRLKVLNPFWATWWFITLCILTFSLLIWLSVQLLAWIKIRKKQREHEADMKYQQSEYKALNALMNPHFIFNSLNNIQGLINKDEKRTANDYLVIFSDLVRQNMHNISKGFISLQQELNLVENYLNLEQLRFKDFVRYEIIVGKEVDTEDIMIPPLMIQPLVENAVKHGLLPRQSADSTVRIHVYEQDNLLYIAIEDNGIGITQSMKSKNRLYESFGLSNLQKRVAHLKKIQQQEISIEVEEIRNAIGNSVGTKALITMSME